MYQKNKQIFFLTIIKFNGCDFLRIWNATYNFKSFRPNKFIVNDLKVVVRRRYVSLFAVCKALLTGVLMKLRIMWKGWSFGMPLIARRWAGFSFQTESLRNLLPFRCLNVFKLPLHRFKSSLEEISSPFCFEYVNLIASVCEINVITTLNKHRTRKT